MLDRANGALFSTAACQTMVLGFKIAVLCVRRGVCHLCQHPIDVAIGRGCFAAAPFAVAFTVALSLACPLSKVFMCRVSTHVGPGFRQQRPSPALAYPRYRIKLLYRGTKRGARNRAHPLAHACDLLFEKVVLCEQLPQQVKVMLGQLSLQRTLQFRYLPAQSALCQLRHGRDVFSPAISASMILRPYTPSTSLATEPS